MDKIITNNHKWINIKNEPYNNYDKCSFCGCSRHHFSMSHIPTMYRDVNISSKYLMMEPICKLGSKILESFDSFRNFLKLNKIGHPDAFNDFIIRKQLQGWNYIDENMPINKLIIITDLTSCVVGYKNSNQYWRLLDNNVMDDSLNDSHDIAIPYYWKHIS